ncbi:related to p53-related protein kinase [Ceraceosorus bombacis]|uniref:non-specific serine/threonine protein kinase n=1 Tax=Ceraceosorus bombacis TaxID=401625 RepID=A0A0P1BID5_9BASI|nr:related to p53-related protein kinase [Ceraceosorus bombacis]
MAVSVEAPTLRMLQSPHVELFSQGAEARIYIYTPPPITTTWLDDSKDVAGSPRSIAGGSAADQLIIKHRFPKKYRHPSLSANLTASRTSLEARALLRAARDGINVPALRFVDETQGVIGLQRIRGRTVRRCLGAGDEAEEEEESESTHSISEHVLSDVASEALDEWTQSQVMILIGRQLALLHAADIIHGDLTTSNMIYVEAEPGMLGRVVLIDFGLTSQSSSAEDRAVDLYVLERAFASTHAGSEHLFTQILDTYFTETDLIRKGKGKGLKSAEILRTLEKVRLRGRKRSMVG